jgi:hypothetical protein
MVQKIYTAILGTNSISFPSLHYYHPQNYLSLLFFSPDYLNSDATMNS